MEELLKYLIPLLGIGGIMAYTFHQKERARKARLKLHTIQLDKETQEIKKQIDAGIKRAKTKLKEYEDAKNKFNDRFPPDGSA